MRLGSVFFLVFLILAEILVLVSFDPVEGFVTIPAPVAFAIITAAVKLKLILVKIMFAMRTMGKFHLLRKREAPELEFDPTNTQNELLAAWTELEREAEHHIHFDMDSCVQAAVNNSTTSSTADTHTHQQGRQMEGWTPIIPTDAPEIETSENEKYAKLISSLIGTMTHSEEACKILQEGLISAGRDATDDQS